jgi:hypothetical protein
MKTQTLEEWLLSRTPPIPRPLLQHLLGPEEDPFQGASHIGALGANKIRCALGKPGRNREAAFDLLAGDALLTYACEALARADDPGREFEGLLRELGDRFR